MSRCIHRLTFIATVIVLVVPATSQAQWQAGVAKESITPKQPMWMSGYASRNHAAEGTLHDLWAKALVIQDPAGEKLVMVSLDLVGIGRELSVAICTKLQKAHGLRRSQIAVCTSHTHTGPVVGHNLGSMYFLDEQNQRLVNEYSDHLIEQTQIVVAAAINDLEPVSLTYDVGKAKFAVNRRNNREADVPKLREAGELKGPVDHSVPVLAVKGAADNLKAVVFGYACHATVLSFYQWSGDWPGFAQLEIEKRHPNTVALFMAGCGADQNPLPRRTVELAEGYGKQIASAVDKVLSGQMQPVTGAVKSAWQEIDLAFGELPDKDQLEKNAQSTNKYEASRARSLLKMVETNGSLSATYPYPVQVWAIGDSARTVFLGGEVVVDYALRIRDEFADRDIWTAAYSNDVMAYIPSKRVLKEGGYEGGGSMVYYGLPTVWSENVEEHVMRTVHELVKAVDKGH